ncbi:kinesin-like protein KIN-4C isoform X1 [Aegilops tauschii subsp. strangulata]|uniref:kinesin-like protein KIN-4C isoform X1 n=2 Tax=Aegilops tauschii subsp. strangulata TaxID=200361 RepID=UPI003CC8E126
MSNFATNFFALPIMRCGCSPALELRFCEFLFRDPMESSDMASQPLSDRVTPKLLLGCTDCVTVMPGEPQTGSGKTYTTGTNYTGEADRGGIIAPLMETIFRKSDAMNRQTEFLIRVSFIEIFKEEVFDLLDDHGSVAKVAAPARVPIQIRQNCKWKHYTC